MVFLLVQRYRFCNSTFISPYIGPGQCLGRTCAVVVTGGVGGVMGVVILISLVIGVLLLLCCVKSRVQIRLVYSISEYTQEHNMYLHSIQILD